MYVNRFSNYEQLLTRPFCEKPKHVDLRGWNKFKFNILFMETTRGELRLTKINFGTVKDEEPG
jgi:hypothetical protein